MIPSNLTYAYVFTEVFEIKLCTVDYVVTQSKKNLRDKTFLGQGIRQSSQNYNISKLIHDYPFCVVAGNRKKNSFKSIITSSNSTKHTLHLYYKTRSKSDGNRAILSNLFGPVYRGRKIVSVRAYPWFISTKWSLCAGPTEFLFIK